MSPSPLSSASSPSYRQPARIRKNPAKASQEDLFAEVGRSHASPSSSHKAKDSPLRGLPDLYEHYEQMSFRQIMDTDFPLDDVPQPNVDRPGVLPSVQEMPKATTAHQEEQTPEPMSRFESFMSQSTVTKPDQQSTSTDCAASISSRHTRTSRASIIARSFQGSDLQEQSVLLLSSDSEDEIYDEPLPVKPSKPAAVRPVSQIPETMALLEQGRSTTPRSPGNADKRLSKCSKSSKRTSFAPSVTYLTIPGGQATSLPYHDSQATIAASPVRASLISSSSASSTPTWQTRSDKSNPGDFAVALLPVKSTQEKEVESELDANDTSASLNRDSMGTPADQPTPPLSPTSVDFYIRSAHTSMDGPGSHNRFMAVTRQEEMLLAALRHKRQTMRESMKSTQAFTETRQPSQRHRSKPSDATITEILDFDFPLPPSFTDAAAKSPNPSLASGSQIRSMRSNASLSQGIEEEDENATPILSPTPTHPYSPKHLLKTSGMSSYEDEESRYRAANDLETPYPTLRKGDFDPVPNKSSAPSERSARSRSRSSRRHSPSSQASTDDSASHSRRRGQSSGKSREDRQLPKLKVSHSMEPVMEFDDELEAPGIPRPDSPISPSVFPVPPTMAPLNKKLARLSAVGATRLGAAPGWWQEEESGSSSPRYGDM